jgi:hypothetical protein
MRDVTSKNPTHSGPVQWSAFASVMHPESPSFYPTSFVSCEFHLEFAYCVSSNYSNGELSLPGAM